MRSCFQGLSCGHLSRRVPTRPRRPLAVRPAPVPVPVPMPAPVPVPVPTRPRRPLAVRPVPVLVPAVAPRLRLVITDGGRGLPSKRRSSRYCKRWVNLPLRRPCPH